MSGLFFMCGLLFLLITLLLLVMLHNEQRIQKEWQKRIEHQHEEIRRQELGLPEGPIIFQNQPELETYITSTLHPLKANPSYIIELEDGRLLPMEHKPETSNVSTPYSYHTLQVAADCLLLEEYSGQPPTHGLLRYADQTLTVEYTPALRRKVLRVLNEMNQFNEEEVPVLQKQKPNRCRACIFKPLCPIGRDK